MEIKRYFIEWERRDELKDAILRAGGTVEMENPYLTIYFMESNRTLLGHNCTGVFMVPVFDPRFSDVIKADLERKLNMKLSRLN